jgi:hypothetical protein
VSCHRTREEGVRFNSRVSKSARRFEQDLGRWTARIGYWQTSDEFCIESRRFSGVRI